MAFMKKLPLILILALLLIHADSLIPNTVGFDLGQVKSYKLLRKSFSSNLYEVEVP